MIKQLFAQLIDTLSVPNPESVDNGDRQAAIRKATAVLMLDVALADRVFDERELARVLELIESHFSLAADEADELMRFAEQAAKDLVSLHEFTQVLHESLSEDEKVSIVALLWDVAYADGELDKHEDALILKIGDLLHVSRVRVMRAKHDAEQAAG